MITKLRGTCVGGEGPNLSRYPNLCHTEERGTFTHLAGKSVEDIAAEANKSNYECSGSNASIVELLDGFADFEEVSFDELLDALRYARANKLI